MLQVFRSRRVCVWVHWSGAWKELKERKGVDRKV